MGPAFLIIFGAFLVEDVILWMRGAFLLREARLRSRLAFHGFLAVQTLSVVAILVAGLCHYSGIDLLVPKLAWVVVVLWHMMVAPVALVGNIAGMIASRVASVAKRLSRYFRPRQEPAPEHSGETGVGVTRREFLGAATTLVPPILTVAVSGVAFPQLSHFRVRRLAVALPQLPRALDDMTIVQVSDTHLGRFTHGQIVRDVVETTNGLRPDLVFFTGDLIDSSLRWLGPGIEMLRAIQAPLVICEGNHDLFDNAALFEARVKASGLPLLVNEAMTLEIRGVPVQVLGLPWAGPSNWKHHGDETELQSSMDDLLRLRDDRAFQILAAHHPHAWDYAQDIPLTLSGHTHGGQLMINERLGAGPVMFRYWSGLYTRCIKTSSSIPQALVVSNGVGNWFPIRIEAPAEIIHLTLRAC